MEPACSLSILEALSKLAQVVMAIAATILVGGLIWQWKTFVLQRRTLEASLFNTVSDKIDRLMDKPLISVDDEEKEAWLERVFAAFEHFAFFANQGFFNPEMEKYYISSMEDICERLQQEKYESLLKYLKGRPEEQLDEFKKFFKRMTGRETPFG